MESDVETFGETDDLPIGSGGDDNEIIDATTRPKKRRGRPRAEVKTPEPAVVTDGGAVKTLEDLDVADLLPKDLPKPAENVKSLGDLVAKYNIGDSTEFKLQVWRTYPKIFPGNIKADGFYDTWDQPLTEELVQSEYGGGNYRIAVIGPHPTKPNTMKHYDSISLNLAGEPKYQRMPRAAQGAVAPASDALPPSPMVVPMQENAKLSETAMKLAVDMAEKEREERRRVEDRAAAQVAQASQTAQPLADAERRRADDLIAAERARSEVQQLALQERLAEEREERRRLMEKLERLESMEGNRPSMAEELQKILPFTRQEAPKSNGSEEANRVAERMMESVLEKHRAEMDAMRSQYQIMIEGLNKQHNEALSTMRAAHTQEMTLTREANTRELSTARESAVRELTAEREAGRRREERVEDQLKMEREERRRDQERQREVLEERDRQWKDRLEMQVQSTNQSWEARHQSVIGNYENRIQWQTQEIDRLKAELSDLKVKITDNQDPIAIVHKAKEIRESLGVPEGGSSSGGGGGGIGINAAEDWKNIAAEGLTERVPQILQALGGLIGGAGQQPQQPQQRQPQVGDVVQTPNGEMVVVQTPNGLALAPRAALEAQVQQQPQQRQALPQQRRRRVMPDAEEVLNQGAGRRRRGKVSAVPNFADMDGFGDPLPKRRPPWEGGGPIEDEEEDEALVTPPPGAPQPQPNGQRRPVPVAAAPQQAPQQRPVRSSRPAEQQQAPQQQRISRQMNAQERQALSVVAKLVHDAVMNADEPEEFADRMLKEWSPDLLKRMVGSYSAGEIARGIMETQPHSAGATPAGQEFVREAFERIEDAING